MVRQKIDLTPFEIIGNDEQGYCIAFGKYKVSEAYSANIKTENESWQDFAWRILNTDMWQIITNMIVIFGDFIKIDAVNEIHRNYKDTNTEVNTEEI